MTNSNRITKSNGSVPASQKTPDYGSVINTADKSFNIASSRALKEYTAIASRDAYQGLESNISVRDQFSRSDYESFRPNEALPEKPQEIIRECRKAYRTVGIIRNVIDLMADFGGQGARLVHPNPTIQKFYRGWWKKIGGNRICDRFLTLFYREGVSITKRTMGRITLKDQKQFRAMGQRLKPDGKMEKQLTTSKRTIPIKYNFLNPLRLNLINEELCQFVGKNVYQLKLSYKLRNSILHPKTLQEKKLVDLIPEDIKKSVKNGAMEIPIEQEKIITSFYKKDDWQNWADPMIYSILKDIIMLEKMKLADLAALDGAISQVRIWKLGDLKEGIFPSPSAINRLEEILLSNPGGGAFDLIWGPELSVDEYKTNIHQFLGKAKYEPVLNSIYDGLGVPPTLTGSVSTSGMTNNYISLKTLIQRLDYGRDALRHFWQQEIELVRQAMGFKDGAKIVFDNMVLSDEAAEKRLLIELVDRDILSIETLLERFGELPEFENLRLNREEKEREKGKMKEKTSPWHRPEKIFEMMKIALQKGYISPEQAGITDDENEFLDVETPFDKQMMKKDRDKMVNKEKQEQQPGRPDGSKDKEKRYRHPKPLGASAAYLTTLLWAKEAQTKISEIITPVFLKLNNKKNLRSLSTEQAAELEKIKFAALTHFFPFSTIDKNSVYDILKTGASAKKEYIKAYNAFYKKMKDSGKNITVEDSRVLQTSIYAILNADESLF